MGVVRCGWFISCKLSNSWRWFFLHSGSFFSWHCFWPHSCSVEPEFQSPRLKQKKNFLKIKTKLDFFVVCSILITFSIFCSHSDVWIMKLDHFWVFCSFVELFMLKVQISVNGFGTNNLGWTYGVWFFELVQTRPSREPKLT